MHKTHTLCARPWNKINNGQMGDVFFTAQSIILRCCGKEVSPAALWPLCALVISSFALGPTQETSLSPNITDMCYFRRETVFCLTCLSLFASEASFVVLSPVRSGTWDLVLGAQLLWGPQNFRAQARVSASLDAPPPVSHVSRLLPLCFRCMTFGILEIQQEPQRSVWSCQTKQGFDQVNLLFELEDSHFLSRGDFLQFPFH